MYKFDRFEEEGENRRNRRRRIEWERYIIKDKERKTSGLVVEETINKEENSESHSHKKERERAKNIEIGRNKSERHRYHAGRSWNCVSSFKLSRNTIQPPSWWNGAGSASRELIRRERVYEIHYSIKQQKSSTITVWFTTRISSSLRLMAGKVKRKKIVFLIEIELSGLLVWVVFSFQIISEK